ncbi:MAG: cytochrome P450, partial [Actinomycetes bacterium]
MGASKTEELLPYPIPNDAALTPPAEWEELRDRCPVAHVRFPSGDEATLLTRYDDVRQVLDSPAEFSSHSGATQIRDPDPEDLAFIQRMILNMDPPEHTRLRKLVARAFTTRRVADLRPRTVELTRGLLDA